MSSGLLLQVVVTGLAAGAAYGLVAGGLVVTWSLARVVNLAHGDVGGGAVFVAIAIVAGTAPVAATGIASWRVGLGVAGALAAAAAAGAALYAGGIRPFMARRSPVGWAAGLAAVAFAIQGTVSAAFAREASVVPEWLPFARSGAIHAGGAVIAARDVSLLVLGGLVAIAAGVILGRSEHGLAVRAIADDPVGAAVSGIAAPRLVAGAGALTAALAGFAALAIAPAAPVLPTFGVLFGVKAMVAATWGGWSSPRRVFTAGLVLGVVEAAIVSLHLPGHPALRLGSQWRDVVPLVIALGVLAVRPPALARERVE